MRLLSFILILFGALSVGTALVGWIPLVAEEPRIDWVAIAMFVATFLALGGGTFWLGTALEKRIPPDKPKVWVLKADDSRFIAPMLRSGARVQVLLGLSILAFDAVWLMLMPPAEERWTASGWPRFEVAISLLFIALFAATALLMFYAAYKTSNTAGVRMKQVLLDTPELVESLTIVRLKQGDAPGTVGQRFTAEIHAGSDTLNLMVSEKHAALLTQYVSRHSPHAQIEQRDWEV